MMRILQPATNSIASRLQAVAGALLIGLIFGPVPADGHQPFWWFMPGFVFAVSPLFLWRLSGWTEGFGFGFLQIIRLFLIFEILGVDHYYNDPATFGHPTLSWGLIVWLVVVVLLLSVLYNLSSRPDRERLRPAADLVTPGLGLPVLAVWLYRYLQLPSPPFGPDFDRLIGSNPSFILLVVSAVLVPFILFLSPLLRLRNLRDLWPEKPGQIVLGLAIETALIFALFGGFRTLYGLTSIGFDEIYRIYAGNTIFSLIYFFNFTGIFFLLLLVSSYCAMPMKPVRFRRALLGVFAVLVLASVAIHYPVFYRPGQFPPPPASILAPNNSEWRMAIPLDMAKGIVNGPVCREVTFYRYLNPVALAEESHCIRKDEGTVPFLLGRLNSAEIHPTAARGFSDALNVTSPSEYIRYIGRNGSVPGPNTFARAEPEPGLRDALEQMEHNHLRLYPPVACGYARAFHHFSDEQRAELYLAICGPDKRYQDTFNQIYLSQSVVKGRVVEMPWPDGLYRMEFSLSSLGSDGGRNKTTEIKADGTFALTGVSTGKHTGWIIVHGDPGVYLGPKKDLVVVYSNSASFEVNGIDPVDLGDIWIKLFPDHPAPELLPEARGKASTYKLTEEEEAYWEWAKDLPDSFSPPDSGTR